MQWDFNELIIFMFHVYTTNEEFFRVLQQQGSCEAEQYEGLGSDHVASVCE